MKNIHPMAQEPNGDKPKYKRDSFTRVITKARKMYDMQLTKDNTVKLLCVETYMKSVFNDTDKFWADYAERINKLLNSRELERECMAWGLNPYTIAEHTVFLGPTKINKVLKYGIYDTLGEDVRLYNDGRFIPEEAIRFIVDIKNEKYPHPLKAKATHKIENQ